MFRWPGLPFLPGEKAHFQATIQFFSLYQKTTVDLVVGYRSRSHLQLSRNTFLLALYYSGSVQVYSVGLMIFDTVRGVHHVPHDSGRRGALEGGIQTQSRGCRAG